MNLLGTSYDENKYRVQYLVIGALISGIYWRFLLFIISVNQYFDWEVQYGITDITWNIYSGIGGLTIPIFCLLSIFIFRNGKRRTFYLNFTLLLAGSLLLFLLSDNYVYILIVICIVGALMGLALPSIFSMAGLLTHTRYRGRMAGVSSAIALGFGGILYLISQFMTLFAFILTCSLSLVFFTLLNKRLLRHQSNIFEIKEIKAAPQRRVFLQYLLTIFSMIFILGLLFSNIAIIFEGGDIFGIPGTQEYFYAHFDFLLMSLTFTCAVVVPVAGYVIDRFGRKNMMILSIVEYTILIFGILSKNFGYVLVPPYVLLVLLVFNVANSLLLVTIIGGDLYPKERMYHAYVYSIASLVAGLFIGILLGLGFYFNQIIPTILFGIAQLFILVLFIGYTKETLPSKDELDWMDAIISLYCIAKNGICLYQESFKERRGIDKDLVAGGISGITSLLKEITQSETPTKMIAQEDVKLLIEFGDNVTCVAMSKVDLKRIRQRLNLLITDIEFLFKKVFPTWMGDTDIFQPIEQLVEKYFKKI